MVKSKHRLWRENLQTRLKIKFRKNFWKNNYLWPWYNIFRHMMRCTVLVLGKSFRNLRLRLIMRGQPLYNNSATQTANQLPASKPLDSHTDNNKCAKYAEHAQPYSHKHKAVLSKDKHSNQRTRLDSFLYSIRFCCVVLAESRPAWSCALCCFPI